MSHLLLFDPFSGGHHAEHIRHVLRGWHVRYGGTTQNRVTIAVAPELLTRHPDLLVLARELGQGAHFVEIDETKALGNGLLSSGLWHRRVLKRLIERIRPTHAFLLYLDHAQLALALGLRFAFPVSLSGLLFRPSFHYNQYESQSPPVRERAQRLRKRLLLGAVLRNPHLSTVFTLDPSAAPAIGSLSRTASVVTLPDPIDPTSLHSGVAMSKVRAAYGVDEGRTLALLFGSLAERKGIFTVLEALKLLPDHAAEQLTVLFAGAARPEIHDRLQDAATQVRGPVQFILYDQFVPDDEIQDLVRASDLVLVPYQRHIGSSGVLIRAAVAGRPVLGQDYGIMGQQIIKHRLGRAVDSTRPEAIAATLEEFLAAPNDHFDATAARAFAERNTVEAYQKVLFDHLRLGS